MSKVKFQVLKYKNGYELTIGDKWSERVMAGCPIRGCGTIITSFELDVKDLKQAIREFKYKEDE